MAKFWPTYDKATTVIEVINVANETNVAKVTKVARAARVRVKICGITREQDAIAAANAGADAIGLVFYPPSPRNVSAAQAGLIAASLPAFVTRVGLFVNPSVEEVEAVCKAVPLDLLQFHGDESAAFCESFARPYIKAIRMHAEVDLAKVSRDYRNAQALLLDSYVQGLYGGTGKAIDWQSLKGDIDVNVNAPNGESKGESKGEPKPIVLAGGLDPANVAQAVDIVRPYAVDVSGGVETSGGIKSADKISDFINAVNTGYRTR